MNVNNVRKLIHLLGERKADGTWDTPGGTFHYDFSVEYRVVTTTTSEYVQTRESPCGCHVGLAYVYDLIDFPGDEEIQTFTGLTEQQVYHIFYDADTYECTYSEITAEMVSRELEKLLIASAVK